MRSLALATLGILLLSTFAVAAPQRCGDDVDGRGSIPCHCGDLLVGSRTLTAEEPLTQAPCAGIGLIVNVPPDQPSPILALGGQTLRGSDRGVGIQVVSGGTGGLVLSGPGSIAHFATGVSAPNGRLASISQVTAEDNRSDGFAVRGTAFTVTDCDARQNGRDGFALSGTRFRVSGNHATSNRRRGFSLAGSEAHLGVEGCNEAARNGKTGMVILGTRHEVACPLTPANAGNKRARGNPRRRPGRRAGAACVGAACR